MGFLRHSFVITLGLCAVLPCHHASGKEAVPPPPAGIDHRPFTQLLQTYVDPTGLVHYSAWRTHAEDRSALDRYLAAFEDPQSPPAEGRDCVASWINLHNALLIRDILRHPVWESVRSDRVFFTDKRHRCRGADVSLEMLSENGAVTRLGWRARGLLMLGARGGPPVLARAVESDALDACVEEVWKRWLTTPAFHWQRPRLLLSPLLLWHRSEWEAEGGWRSTLPAYLTASDEALVQDIDIPVEYSGFDWTLNDPAVPPGSYGPGQMLRDRLPW